jgi:hypothetical protein
MPTDIDTDSRRAIYNEESAGGPSGRGPQYSFLNFVVYIAITFILLAFALAIVPQMTGNFRANPPDPAAPINMRTR